MHCSRRCSDALGRAAAQRAALARRTLEALAGGRRRQRHAGGAQRNLPERIRGAPLPLDATLLAGGAGCGAGGDTLAAAAVAAAQLSCGAARLPAAGVACHGALVQPIRVVRVEETGNHGCDVVDGTDGPV